MASSRVSWAEGETSSREMPKGRGFTGSPRLLLRQVPTQHLPEVLPALADLPDHGGFESAMHHTIAAPLVPFVLVLLPVCFRRQLVEGLVVGIGDQIAGTLPALRIEIGIAPRRTLQLPLPLQITEE